jgi:hypothetical protein
LLKGDFSKLKSYVLVEGGQLKQLLKGKGFKTTIEKDVGVPTKVPQPKHDKNFGFADYVEE